MEKRVMLADTWIKCNTELSGKIISLGPYATTIFFALIRADKSNGVGV